MKLQVNTSGAWKNVVEFDAARRDEVLKALRVLQSALGQTVRWSILHDNGLTREWLKL